MPPAFLNMKNPAFIFAMLLALAVGSCAGHAGKPTSVKPVPAKPGPIITPDFSLAAKVVSINTQGRFVVLSFPASLMPGVGQTMFLYHNGLKTAVVRITGPQQDNNIVADIVSGDAQMGDTVNDR